jgi:nucleotide-binding universal stress UspA family protein
MLRMLLAVDGSDGSRHATVHAARLAREAGVSEVHLLNVQEPAIHYGMVGAYIPSDVMRKLQDEAAERALRPSEKLLARVKVPYRRQVRVGPVASTIAETAEALGCNSIVMGTRGMTAAANLVVGSIPTKVLHLTRIPVTLVPAGPRGGRRTRKSRR